MDFGASLRVKATLVCLGRRGARRGPVQPYRAHEVGELPNLAPSEESMWYKGGISDS